MLKKIKDWVYNRETTERMLIYMRSGNVISVDNVTNWKVDRSPSGKITRITLEQKQKRGEAFLILASIDVAQIEAITVVER